MLLVVPWLVILLLVMISQWVCYWAIPKCNGELPSISTMGLPRIGDPTMRLVSPRSLDDIRPFIRKYGHLFQTSSIDQHITAASTNPRIRSLHAESKNSMAFGTGQELCIAAEFAILQMAVFSSTLQNTGDGLSDDGTLLQSPAPYSEMDCT